MRLYTVNELIWLSSTVGIILFVIGTGSSPLDLNNFTILFTSSMWPLTILLLALGFRSSIVKLMDVVASRISDLQKVAGSNWETIFQTREGVDLDDSLDKLPSTVELPALTGRGANAVINLEKVLFESAEALQGSCEDKLKIALRDLAISRLQATCFDTYNVVFRSQIELLMAIANASVAYPVSKAIEYYEKAKEKDPEFYGKYSFEAWLRYMEKDDLVRIHENGLNINYKGEYFIQFLEDFGMPWHRRPH